MSVELLQIDHIHRIMLNLSTLDVLRCMQVCKYWKTVLSDQYFWKKFVQRRFDLTLKPETEEFDGPLYQWSDPEHWFCYFDDKDPEPYVIRPFPSVLKCDVVVPHGLDLLSANVKHLQGLSRSLEILVHMKMGIKSFRLACGNQCSPNEGSNDICVVLFPWEEDHLPDATAVISKIFHFHPEICEKPFTKYFEEKLHHHLVGDKHNTKVKPCLNQVFGLSHFWNSQSGDSEEELAVKQQEFFSWLRNIMVPTRRFISGEGKLNPVVDFFITKLAPGWVGGALTGQTWT